jgi:riboflavin-specific deaminase-like protein
LRLAHRLRGIHDGILVGIGTLLKDNPRLTVRMIRGANPFRIIVDTNLKIPLTANVLADHNVNKTIIVTTKTAREEKVAAISKLGARVLKISQDCRGWVNLKEMLFELGRLGLSSIMVEGGGKIITSLFKDRLVDRLVVAVAPKVIGQGIEAVGDLGIENLTSAFEFTDVSYRKIGVDFVFEGRPVIK